MIKIRILTFSIIAFSFMNLKESYADIWAVNFSLDGSKVVPPVISNGIGTVAGTYNDITNELSFTITFSNLTGNTIGGHFHGPASVTENAGTLISWTGFPLGVKSGTYSNTFILAEFMETALLQGRIYADIHTTFAANGEIRSQVSTLARIIGLDYLIEGFYNPNTNYLTGDTITLNLRSSTSPFNLIEGKKAKLDSTGKAFFFQWSVAPSFVPYYIQVLHRNALETWSSTTVLWNTTWLVTYDFKNLQSKAFGNNMVNVNTSPMRFAAYGGDVNQSGTVDLDDLLSVYNAAVVFTAGYVVNDVNGDNIVDLIDITLTYNNVSSFVSRVRP